jgi:Na+/phosphate symporter
MPTKEQIEAMVKTFKLQDWEIDVQEDETITDCARTLLIFNDYKACIKLKKQNSDIEQEKSLIHELLHLIFRDAYDIFDAQCKDEFAKEYCQKQHERAIEKTSKIIYSLLHSESEVTNETLRNI